MTGIYFLRHKMLVKVGYSRLIGHRAHVLAHERPGASVIGIIPCALEDAPKLEASWHKRLQQWRHSGEWFHVSPEVLDAIRIEALSPSEEDLKPLRNTVIKLSVETRRQIFAEVSRRKGLELPNKTIQGVIEDAVALLVGEK